MCLSCKAKWEDTAHSDDLLFSPQTANTQKVETMEPNASGRAPQDGISDVPEQTSADTLLPVPEPFAGTDQSDGAHDTQTEEDSVEAKREESEPRQDANTDHAQSEQPEEQPEQDPAATDTTEPAIGHMFTHSLILYRLLPKDVTPDIPVDAVAIKLNGLEERLSSFEARMDENLQTRFSSFESRLDRLESMLTRISIALESSGQQTAAAVAPHV